MALQTLSKQESNQIGVYDCVTRFGVATKADVKHLKIDIKSIMFLSHTKLQPDESSQQYGARV